MAGPNRPGGNPEQWQEQRTTDGPEFGQRLYPGGDAQAGQGGHAAQGGAGEVQPDEALGSYAPETLNEGGAVWRPTDAALASDADPPEGRARP